MGRIILAQLHVRDDLRMVCQSFSNFASLVTCYLDVPGKDSLVMNDGHDVAQRLTDGASG